jgi:hypothetical protein
MIGGGLRYVNATGRRLPCIVDSTKLGKWVRNRETEERREWMLYYGLRHGDRKSYC